MECFSGKFLQKAWKSFPRKLWKFSSASASISKKFWRPYSKSFAHIFQEQFESFSIELCKVVSNSETYLKKLSQMF